MLRFEREVVRALVGPGGADRAEDVEAYVERALADFPEPVRAGILAESVLLGAGYRVRSRLGGRRDARSLVAALDRWEESPISFVRQYVRALRSLTLFADQELAPDPV